MTDSDALPPSARLQRIRALSAELDSQRQLSLDRGKTQDAKASFVLVVVGLVASVASNRLGDSALWVVGLLPVAAALVAAVEAVFVLWPRRIAVVDASALVLAWVDKEQSQEDLEDYLLESKRKEILHRDNKHETTTPHLRRAFWFLIASVALLFAMTIVDGFTPNRGDLPVIDPATPTAAPSAVPSSQRPDTDATMQTLYASNPEQPKTKTDD